MIGGRRDLYDIFKNMGARSILVVSDSCFAGDMFRGLPPGDSSPAEDPRNGFLEAAKHKSRRFITSGGNKPVYDGGCNSHSKSACAFLGALDTMMSTERMFYASKRFDLGMDETHLTRPPEPHDGVIPDSGDQFGDFLFVRSEAVLAQSDASQAPVPATVR